MLVGGAAGIGLIAAFWQKTKEWIGKVFHLLFEQSTIHDHNIITAVALNLTKNYKYIKLTKREFVGIWEYIRPIKTFACIAIETPSSEATLWYNTSLKHYIYLALGATTESMTITYLKGTFNIETFLKDSLDLFRESRQITSWKSIKNNGSRFYVFRLTGSLGEEKRGREYNQGRPEAVEGSAMAKTSGIAPGEGRDRCLYVNSDLKYEICKPIYWNKADLGSPIRESPIDKLSLQQHVLDAVEEARRWRDSEEWFKSRLIPWKRGFLLWGAAGTGKTAFVRALGQELDMPVASFDISTMTNQDFINNWDNAMGRSPCIVLIEDIDAVFEGRKNVAVQGLNQGLSFDCLLNTIDGVQNTDGMFLVITTNNADKLDPAIGNPIGNGEGMSTRPGRIDRAIKFDILDEAGRLKMADRIFAGFDRGMWGNILETGKNDTGAQFQERCCRAALKLFWEKEKKKNEALKTLVKPLFL